MSAGFATEIILSRSIKYHKLDVVMHKVLTNALTFRSQINLINLITSLE